MFSTHTLQLVINDGVFVQPCVVDLLVAGRKLVGHFKCSNANIHTLNCIQDEPTRWNTSYYMLERLIEQRQAICTAEIECKVKSELTNHQWQLAEKVVKV